MANTFFDLLDILDYQGENIDSLRKENDFELSDEVYTLLMNFALLENDENLKLSSSNNEIHIEHKKARIYSSKDELRITVLDGELWLNIETLSLKYYKKDGDIFVKNTTGIFIKITSYLSLDFEKMRSLITNIRNIRTNVRHEIESFDDNIYIEINDNSKIKYFKHENITFNTSENTNIFHFSELTKETIEILSLLPFNIPNFDVSLIKILWKNFEFAFYGPALKSIKNIFSGQKVICHFPLYASFDKNITVLNFLHFFNMIDSIMLSNKQKTPGHNVYLDVNHMNNSAEPFEIYDIDASYCVHLENAKHLDVDNLTIIETPIKLIVHKNGIILDKSYIFPEENFDLMKSSSDTFEFDKNFALSENNNLQHKLAIHSNKKRFLRSLCLIEKTFKERKNILDSNKYAKIIDSIQHGFVVQNTWKILDYGYFENIEKCILSFGFVFVGSVCILNGLIEGMYSYIHNNFSMILFSGLLILIGLLFIILPKWLNKKCLFIVSCLIFLTMSLTNVHFNNEYAKIIIYAMFPFAKFNDLVEKTPNQLHLPITFLMFTFQIWVSALMILFGISIKRLFTRINN